MLSKNDLERERYEARVKFEMDRLSFLEEARQEGLTKGREQGREEGVKVITPRIQFYERMLKLPPTPTEELIRLSVEELEAKAQALEKQLAPHE